MFLSKNNVDINNLISRFMEEGDQFESLHLTFKIPFCLRWIGPVEVKINNITAKLELSSHFKTEKKQEVTAGKFMIISGNAELIRERKGLLSYTEIIVYFNSFMSDYDYIELSIACVNKLLDMYKIYYPEEYHIQKVKKDDLLDGIRYSCQFLNRSPIGGFLSFQGITIPKDRTQVPEEIREYLSSGNQYPYWKLALANARNKFYLEDYPMTIVEANIALEGFIYEHIYDRLKSKWRKEDIDNFLHHYSPCNTCDFRKKSKATELVVKPSHPSIHKVIKLMYTEAPLPSIKSNKRLDRLIKKITEYRNHIVHGNRPPAISREYAKTALDTLESLINESITSCGINDNSNGMSVS